MDTQFLGAFESATLRVFDMMAGITLVADPPFANSSTTTRCLHEINAIVPIGGRLTGTVVVGVDRGIAMAFTENVLGFRPQSIDEDVVDAVKELANMIVGQVESQLGRNTLVMSLPTVAIGKGTEIGFGSKVNTFQQSFQKGDEALTLLFGLPGESAATVAGAATPKRRPQASLVG